MRTRRGLLKLAMGGVLLGTAFGLAACAAPLPASRCEFVKQRHLVRQRHGSGRTLICNPQQVNARYRERYFPGYQWGDPR